MRLLNLFDGIGGFGLAAKWIGWDNVASCEIDPYCRRVLDYWFDYKYIYDDITTTDFTPLRGHIDLVTGGFPCQPFSLAGQRLGEKDSRHLWPHMLRAVREVRPRWVVAENVRGLITQSGGLVFEKVCAGLESAGYEVQPFVLPACGVGAPHRRDRLWIVAHSDGDGRQEEAKRRPAAGQEVADESESILRNVDVADARRIGSASCGAYGEAEGSRGGNNAEPEERCEPSERHNGLPALQRYAPETDGDRRRNWEVQHEYREEREAAADNRHDGKDGNAYNAVCIGRNTGEVRAEIHVERKRESEPHATGGRQYGWRNFPSQSPVCRGDDGISGRLVGITFPKWREQTIKMLGNSVVPQVVYQIYKAIEEYENRID